MLYARPLNLEAPKLLLGEQTLAIQNGDYIRDTQDHATDALNAMEAPGLRLARGRKPDRVVALTAPGTGQTTGRRGLGGCGEQCRGSAWPPRGRSGWGGGLRAGGVSWGLSKNPGAAHPTVGVFMEANGKQQNENKLHPTVCLS